MTAATRRFTLADALLLLTILIWGLNVTVVKLLLHDIHPMALSVLRFSLTSIIFLTFVPITEGTPRVSRSTVPLLVAAALCGIWLNQVAFTYGLEYTTAANMTMLLTMVPIFAGVVAFTLGWERPGRRHWIGVVVGVVGVVLIVLGSPHSDAHPISLIGNLLALLTAASWAAYSLLLRPLLRLYSAPRVSMYVTSIGLLALLPFGDPQFAATSPHMWDPKSIGLLVYSSVGAVVLTNIFWYTGIHKLGPSRATVYSYLQPFGGVLFALLILHEPVTALEVAGGITILAGIIFGREPQVAPAAE